MSEIPDVVPGEPVESAWGNSVRDRTIQRYADQTALDASVPIPEPGTVAWLDDPGLVVIYDDTDWVPLGNRSQPLTTFQQVERANSGMAQWRRIGNGWITWQIPNGGGLLLDLADELGANTIRPLTIDYPSGIASLPFGIDTNLLVTGANGARLQLDRRDLPVQWRLAIGNPGVVLVQSSTDGTTWTTRYTWQEDELTPAVPIRMSGNTGNRLHYRSGSGGTLTPDFEAVFDSLGSSPFPTDQQLYRGAAAVRVADVAALEAEPEVTTYQPLTARAATPSIDDVTPMVVTTDAGKSGAVLEVPDTWELGGTQRGVVAMLVAEVQALRARVAALEGA